MARPTRYVLGTLLCALALGPSTRAQLVQLTQGASDWEDPNADDKGRSVIYFNGSTLYLFDVKRGTSNVIAVDVDDARISSSGKHVVYASSGNPLGGNVDGNAEVFLYDVKRGTTVQVTNTTGEDNEGPSTDKKGRMIAFRSRGDHLGTNPDGGEEIFVFDTKTQVLAQITDATVGARFGEPIVEATGKFVWFHGDDDLVGTNSDGNDEIFRYDVKFASLEQLTMTTNGDCTDPRPNKNGKLVVFTSDSDQLRGPNADGRDEIYLLDVKAGTFTRVTDLPRDAARPTISSNGKVVAFETDADPLAFNADGSVEIFVVTIQKGSVGPLAQVTDGSATTESRRPSLDTAGKALFFQSNADLMVGGAALGNEHVFQLRR